MRDAKYFRARAEQCLNIARLMSDRTAADHLRFEAAENIGRAVALEARSDPPISNSSATVERRGQLPDFANGDSKSSQPDIWKENHYRGVIRATIGQELGSRYGLPQQLPHRIFTLLMQLNEHQHRGKTGR
jgi:hypothetical protein